MRVLLFFFFGEGVVDAEIASQLLHLSLAVPRVEQLSPELLGNLTSTSGEAYVASLCVRPFLFDKAPVLQRVV